MVSYPVGMGLISACLREAGHDTRVVHLNQELGRPMDLASCEQEARQYKPELVGFSCTSGQFKFVRQLAPLYKYWLNMPILCGGIHATVAPDQVLSTPGIDLICRGEGEEAVVELADALAHGRDWHAIHNLGYLQDGQATLNPLRPLVADLDRLPYPDRQRFDFGRIVELKRGFANLMAGRGCLFHCTYCVNNFFHKAYAGIAKGRQFTRMRSAGRVLGEIQ
jgi:anaerobic magnesium-protoporphyrin IX monomethyl ester cyclase